jgi:hypothetical protein
MNCLLYQLSVVVSVVDPPVESEADVVSSTAVDASVDATDAAAEPEDPFS